MAKKVLPGHIDTETLMSQVESEVVEINQEETVHHNILEFISFYGIEPGENPIKKRVLYKMYDSWNKSNGYGANYFSLRMSELFKYEKGCYYINLNSLTLTSKAKEVFFKPENTEKAKSKKWKAHLEKFLEEFCIVPGRYTIKQAELYYIYEDWARIDKKRILSIIDFGTFCSYYFKHYKFENYVFYIDKAQLKVDGVTLEKAKKWAQKYKKGSAESKNRKKEFWQKLKKESQT